MFTKNQNHFLNKSKSIEDLLEPKKKILELITLVDNSMLNFHKTVKSSKDIELLANSFFENKKELDEIKKKSGDFMKYDNITNKIINLKSIKAKTIDFI